MILKYLQKIHKLLIYYNKKDSNVIVEKLNPPHVSQMSGVSITNKTVLPVCLLR